VLPVYKRPDLVAQIEGISSMNSLLRIFIVNQEHHGNYLCSDNFHYNNDEIVILKKQEIEGLTKEKFFKINDKMTPKEIDFNLNKALKTCCACKSEKGFKMIKTNEGSIETVCLNCSIVVKLNPFPSSINNIELGPTKGDVDKLKNLDKLNNVVIHPDHYNKGIECWDYTTSHDMNFLQGNVVKYVTRYKQKNGLQDLEKAMQYLEKLIESVKGE
jgi:hypothetical protein